MHAGRAAGEIDDAVGEDWYEPGGAADRAALTLCRLRRARAGELGSTRHGDEAVRNSLAQANPDALVWLASRAISFMDESGFPEAVEPWFDDVGAVRVSRSGRAGRDSRRRCRRGG